MTFTVVPFNYDLEANPSKVEYHGVFISNGPGDPTMCNSTIKSLRWLMKKAEEGEKPVPIFGICLGNQLLALAAGAKVMRDPDMTCVLPSCCWPVHAGADRSPFGGVRFGLKGRCCGSAVTLPSLVAE